MKVKVTHTEVQHFEMTKEIEMTAAEFKAYEAIGQTPDNMRDLNLKHGLTGQCGDEFHTVTEVQNIFIEKK